MDAGQADELMGSKLARKRRATRLEARPESGPVAGETELGDLGAREQVSVVKKLLRQVERKLSDGDVKASLGDYIRLVQLHKELDEETPREIKVTWVEPQEAKPE